MSGTSLDGIDLCYADFSFENQTWNFDIIAAETITYSSNWIKKLSQAPFLNGLELSLLNVEYGSFLAKTANTFCDKNKLTPYLIGSHGHTIFHQPEKNFTLQIGSGAEIATKTGIKTCCDFRTSDISFKGQGAPLVPIGDQLLFPNFDACLNIGGFCNISIKQNSLTAFDISPANLVLNFLAEKVGLNYDKNGDLARSGKLDQELLNQFNKLDYYYKSPPKSLGREWVEKNINPILEKCTISIEDQLHTFCIHIAEQVAKSTSFNEVQTDILITGGGAKNKFLMECFQQNGVQVNIPNEQVIDFKEALIFAFLGLLRDLEITNTLSSVTGAKKDSIGGCIYLP